jgi:hypothetical protein
MEGAGILRLEWTLRGEFLSFAFSVLVCLVCASFEFKDKVSLEGQGFQVWGSLYGWYCSRNLWFLLHSSYLIAS